MNNRNSCQYFGLALVMIMATAIPSYAQYISSITYPDTTQAKMKNSMHQWSQTIDPADFKNHVYTLASDEYGGRELGTEGNAMAAKYLVEQFQKMGLPPLKGSDTYEQEVDFSWIYWDDISMHIHGKKYKQLWDFIAFQDKNVGGEINTNIVTFLGYGIDDENYTDYKKAKVNDKVILIYNGEPKNENGQSRITGSKELSSWSTDVNKKLNAAKKHGVRHVLIVADNIQKMVEDNRRQLLGAKVILGKPEDQTGPVDYTYISSTMARSLLGKKIKKVIKRKECITQKGKSKPVKVKTQLQIMQKKRVSHLSGVNVAAMIEGTSKKDEYVFLTAHYDHIGQKGRDINNGADDNASGTSTVLEIAQAFAQAANSGIRPERSVVFMLVTGEEKGLLGSDYYVENPIIPLENTMVDINIDMVGRVTPSYEGKPNYIYVIGSDRISKDLHRINEQVNKDYSHLILDYKFNSEQDPNRFYYRSDHYNFAKKGIPSIFFFNGTHADYHRPTDTADKINYPKMAEIGRHIFQLSWELANIPKSLDVAP